MKYKFQTPDIADILENELEDVFPDSEEVNTTIVSQEETENISDSVDSYELPSSFSKESQTQSSFVPSSQQSKSSYSDILDDSSIIDGIAFYQKVR